MGQDDRVDDRQTEPGADDLGAARGVEPHEGLEDALGVRGVHADAGVAHRHDGEPAITLERQLHLAAGFVYLIALSTRLTSARRSVE